MNGNFVFGGGSVGGVLIILVVFFVVNKDGVNILYL